MPQFKYSAKNKQGEMQTGVVKAANETAALNILSGHELYVLAMDEVAEQKPFASKLLFFRRAKRADVMIFTRQLATLLGAKIPLADSLKTLQKQTINQTLKGVLVEIAEDVDTGFSLSQAMSKHGDVFTEFYVNMIRSAEVTGRMEEVMNYLADYLEKESGLISKVRNAMLYPVFIIVMFGGVSVFLITVILPQLKPIFIESNIELPIFTRILMGSGEAIKEWWWVVLLIGGVGGFVLFDYVRSREGRALVDDLKLKIPILGKMYKQAYVARFAESTSVLIKGGVPIAQAIEITARTIGNSAYENALTDASQSIRRGDLISTAISRHEKYFPPFTYQMVAVGETTGRLEELLGRIAQFYTREVESIVGSLVELIQPLLIVFIGGTVGLLFGSILIPIFKVAQAF